MTDLRAQILARLDAWATTNDPGEVFDATERMYNALRAIVIGPDWGDVTPSYLPQPWADQTIAAALGITTADGDAMAEQTEAQRLADVNATTAGKE